METDLKQIAEFLELTTNVSFLCLTIGAIILYFAFKNHNLLYNKASNLFFSFGLMLLCWQFTFKSNHWFFLILMIFYFISSFYFGVTFLYDYAKSRESRDNADKTKDL